MFATILRGKVTSEDWDTLQQRFEQLFKSPPEGLAQSFLAQDHLNKNHWEIITLWKSEAAYLSARDAKKTEACENLFCEAGSVPERVCFHIRRNYQRV